MVKTILIGSPHTQWNIGNRFIAGGTIIDLSEEEVKTYKAVIKEVLSSELQDVKKEVVKEVKKEVKKEVEQDSDLYTEEELFKLKKADQVRILNTLGITDIPRLEKDRVKTILEAQK